MKVDFDFTYTLTVANLDGGLVTTMWFGDCQAGPKTIPGVQCDDSIFMHGGAALGATSLDGTEISKVVKGHASIGISNTGFETGGFRLHYDNFVYVNPGYPAPIPEPETYATLLMGLSALVLRTRARRNRAT